MTPCGNRFFSVGINGIDPSLGAQPARHSATHSEGAFHDAPGWTEQTLGLLKEWGFNTAGSFSSDNLALPTIPELDLGWKSNFLWGDPFDPATAQRMRGAARDAVGVYKHAGKRIGYFSDNEVGWWSGALFRFYIAQPASNYTKRELVEFDSRLLRTGLATFRRRLCLAGGHLGFWKAAEKQRRAGADAFRSRRHRFDSALDRGDYRPLLPAGA